MKMERDTRFKNSPESHPVDIHGVLKKGIKRKRRSNSFGGKSRCLKKLGPLQPFRGFKRPGLD